MNQAITKLAAEMAEHINETKIEGGYTIVCTHLDLHHMVGQRVGQDMDLADAVSDFFEEMLDEHGMFLTVTRIGNIAVR